MFVRLADYLYIFREGDLTGCVDFGPYDGDGRCHVSDGLNLEVTCDLVSFQVHRNLVSVRLHCEIQFGFMTGNAPSRLHRPHLSEMSPCYRCCTVRESARDVHQPQENQHSQQMTHSRVLGLRNLTAAYGHKGAREAYEVEQEGIGRKSQSAKNAPSCTLSRSGSLHTCTGFPH
eukprot:3907864-Rhodomonas_salina.2